MKIFSDLHHGALYYSLQLLFEGRLSFRLYRPIGKAWFDSGYWKIAEPYENNLGTVAQFLEDCVPADGSRPLNRVKQDTGGYYLVKAPKDHKAVTLEQFKEIKFDIVIASIPQHLAPYTELIKKYQPEAKLIYQIGNHFGPVDFSLAKNVMASTAPFSNGVNAVFYHQEFNLDTFCYKPPLNDRKIYSFVHCLGGKDYEDYKEYKKALLGFEFKSFGAGCDDGAVSGWEHVAEKMHQSMFGFHLKSGGDGFGHIIHNWFACGRPPIVRMSQYKDKLAGELMIDGKTCLDLDGRTLGENVERIKYYSQPEEHKRLCQQAYDRFCEVVDFDREEQELRRFIENLQ